MPKRSNPYRAGLLQDLRESPQDALEYLKACVEDSEEMFLVALNDVAEAYGIIPTRSDDGR